jgi:hypothetical protein
VAAGRPTPLTAGGQATIGGVTFMWPSVVGAPDNVIADGQIIDLWDPETSSASWVGRLRSGEREWDDHLHRRHHPALQHLDGGLVQQRPGQRRRDRHHHIELELREQHADAASGQRVLASVPLDSGKTVKSLTLPTVGSGVGNGINAMHIFSIAVGNGTPTSGG